MGKKEEDASAKTSKPSSTQEQPPPSSPATVFPDWASFQAYYNPAGTAPVPHGFYPSVASSPQGHPYMWSPQHIMPPYGTPPPYVAMYPTGGLYPHPTIPLVAVTGTAEVDGKPDEGKERSPIKGTKGSLGSLNVLTGKNNEREKTSGVSTNDLDSHSDETGSDASSEGSGTNSDNGSQQKQCQDRGESKGMGNAGSESANAARTSTASSHVSPIMAIPSSAIAAPTTTLNIGMDYWSGTSATVTPVRSKLPITPSPAALVPSREAVPSDMWLQDEREVKRQRRKQSNRESARRSRLRKQAEYEELAHRVGLLNEENHGLREELARIQEECEKLASENASLADKLEKSQGGESRTNDDHGQLESDAGMTKKTDGMNAGS